MLVRPGAYLTYNLCPLYGRLLELTISIRLGRKGFPGNTLASYEHLYYKHVTIVKYASSGVNKLKASLNDDAKVIIYNHHMFIVQATGPKVKTFYFRNLYKFS